MAAKIVVVCDICENEVKDEFKTISIYHKNKDDTHSNINYGYDMCNACYAKLVFIDFDKDGKAVIGKRI